MTNSNGLCFYVRLDINRGEKVIMIEEKHTILPRDANNDPIRVDVQTSLKPESHVIS